MGLILAAVLVAVLFGVGGRWIYRNIILPRRSDRNTCPHCGKSYKDEPYYCPHCGKVVEFTSSRG